MPDSLIDFSDIPESTDQELRRARRVGRPKSGSAKPYQTLIHELLESGAKN
jgi:hypothetical protein